MAALVDLQPCAVQTDGLEVSLSSCFSIGLYSRDMTVAQQCQVLSQMIHQRISIVECTYTAIHGNVQLVKNLCSFRYSDIK